MVADLTPAKAKAKDDEGGGWGLEADELGHESLGAVQCFLKIAEAEVRGRERESRAHESG